MKVSALALLAVPGAFGFTNHFNSRAYKPAAAGSMFVQQQQQQANALASRNTRPRQTQPNSMLLMAVPTLDNWRITTLGEVSGVVKNHPDPNIKDGELVTTSTLATARAQIQDGMTVVTSSGSKYKLGQERGSFGKTNPNTKSKSAQSTSSIFGKWGAPSAAVEPKKSPFANWGASTRVPILDDWSVTNRGGVTGIVTKHPDPNIDNGDILTTSSIIENRNTLVQGQTVSTSSGSKYILGKKKAPSARSRSNNVQQAYGKSPPPAPSPPPPSFNPFMAFSKVAEEVTNSGSQQIANVISNFSVAIQNNKPTVPPPAPARAPAPANSIKIEAARIANLRDLKLKYGVNGKSVGDGKYLLCGKPQRSTSGKSTIWSAYRAGPDGVPTGEKLTIKVSSNYDAISREDSNYNRVCSGLFPGRFVEKTEFLPEVLGSPVKEFKVGCALVIESGRKDLKAILAERGGRGFEGRAMRDAAIAALQCIQAMHSSGIVWTDLKTENFVIVSDEIGDNGNLPGVKGIDLESAMPQGANPVDFSPEACPPEFASAFISGEGLSFKLEYSYDIFSYGMMLYELTTGRCYFGSKTPAQITKSLQYGTFSADVSLVTDPKLKDLISLCLQEDPRKRPGVAKLLVHPYFLSSGLGPFGW